MRRFLVQVHLWLGLTLGVLGIFIGITGSVLLYDHEIDGWLNPQRYAVSGSEVSLDHAGYARSAGQALAGRARVVNLRMPEEKGMPVVATARVRDANEFYRVYMDPPTGRVLEAVAGGGFIGWVHRFHENLTLREYWGRELVGLVGFAMLFSALSGIYLWWPARGRFREGLGVRSGFAPSRNLHYLFGFYGSLVLALLSFTGIWLAYPDAGRNVVSAFSPLSPLARNIQAPEPAAAQEPIPVGDAVIAARALYPGAEVTGIGFPSGPRGTYRINLRRAGEPISLFLDPATGAALNRIDSSTRSTGDGFLAAQRRIHTGEAFGGLGRALFFVAGFLPALLAPTGAIMWWRQRRLRASAMSGAAAAASSEA